MGKGNRVVVIGGGAAGLLAGITAARNGAGTIILEKMDVPGRKMMITGKGRCNITNTCAIPEFIRNLPGNGKFLNGALRRFTNEDMMDLLESHGLPLVKERGGRVFPASGRARDVLDTLLAILTEAGGRVVTNAQAVGLVLKDGRVTGVRYCNVEDDGRKEGQDYRSASQRREKLGPAHVLDADAVIVCTGGASYPGTGSDGNFVPVLEKAGHTVEPLLPALVPLQPEEGFTEELDGLALKNVRATLCDNGQAVTSEFGELLFTRGTVAGPIALTMSRAAARLAHYGNRGLDLVLDLKPALDEEKARCPHPARFPGRRETDPGGSRTQTRSAAAGRRHPGCGLSGRRQSRQPGFQTGTPGPAGNAQAFFHSPGRDAARGSGHRHGGRREPEGNRPENHGFPQSERTLLCRRSDGRGRLYRRLQPAGRLQQRLRGRHGCRRCGRCKITVKGD